MIVVTCSLNPVKAKATEIAFWDIFPDLFPEHMTFDAHSGVSVQPRGISETVQGARNRVLYARHHIPKADYWISFEGGVTDDGVQMYEVAYVCVLDKSGKSTIGSTNQFLIPNEIAKMIRGGMEHGPAADIFFGVESSKKKEGTIGLISDQMISRTDLYVPALKNALLPFKHPEFYV